MRSWALAIALAACGGGSSGSPDASIIVAPADAAVAVPDASGAADAGVPDAPAPAFDAAATSLVTIDRKRTCELSGTVQLLDLSDDGFAAIAGGVTYPGTGHLDGTAEIAGVPESEFTLRWTRAGFFYVSSARAFDLGTAITRRCDGTAQISGPATFDATNLAPWTAADWLTLWTPGAGLLLVSIQSVAPSAPQANDTALSGMSFDLAGFSPPIVNPQKGDVTYLSQVRTVTGPTTVRSIVRAGSSSTFDTVSGAPAFSAAMAEPPPARLQTTFKGSAFAALVPGATPLAKGLLVDTAPPGTTATLGEVVTRTSGAAPADEAIDLAYGDPFPAPWPRRLGVTWAYTRELQLPGASSTTVQSGYLLSVRPLAELGETIEPRLGPVRDVRVDGRDPAGGLTAVGLTPTITWSPPALGAPTMTVVSVNAFRVVAGAPTPQGLVAVFYTAGSALTIPAGVLAGDRIYVLQIDAVRADGATPERPAYTSKPRDEALVIVGPLSP